MYTFNQGDSGGPLVQYVNGRAVLIGIESGSLSDYVSCLHNNTKDGFVRISRRIDDFIIAVFVDWWDYSGKKYYAQFLNKK